MSEVVVSPAVVQEWEGKRKTLIDEAAVLERKIQAARLLLDMADIEVPPPPKAPPPLPAASEPDDNMARLIEFIANNSDSPLTYREMKDRLKGEGIPEERLVNYFYTAVGRLKTKGKISVGADKLIGRGVSP